MVVAVTVVVEVVVVVLVATVATVAAVAAVAAGAVGVLGGPFVLAQPLRVVITDNSAHIHNGMPGHPPSACPGAALLCQEVIC